MRKITTAFALAFLFALQLFAQGIQWASDGNVFFSLDGGQIVKTTLPGMEKSVVVSTAQLTPVGPTVPTYLYAFSTPRLPTLLPQTSPILVSWLWAPAVVGMHSLSIPPF